MNNNLPPLPNQQQSYNQGYNQSGNASYGNFAKQQANAGYSAMEQYRLQQTGRTYALDEATMSAYMTKVMSRVYLKMFVGLLITALAAVFLVRNQSLLFAIYSNQIIFWGLMIAELAVVFVISGMINRLSTTVATLLFYLYSALNGVVFASVLMVYTGSSIALTFGVTSAVFLAMSIYGYTTKADLTKFGTYMIMGLIGVIIASIANIFFKSSALEWIVSIIGIVIFVGLTAWDTQKIRRMAMETDEANVGKLATLGALSLYLDFINLFLYLLRFLGKQN